MRDRNTKENNKRVVNIYGSNKGHNFQEVRVLFHEILGELLDHEVFRTYNYTTYENGLTITTRDLFIILLYVD